MHEGCARSSPDDCKPVVLSSSDMHHLWKPAGTIYQSLEVGHWHLCTTCCHEAGRLLTQVSGCKHHTCGPRSVVLTGTSGLISSLCA